MLSHCQPYRKSTCHQQFNVNAYAHWIVDPARISSFERTPLGVSLMEILTINASQQGWGFVGKPESITKMEKPGTMSVYIGNFHISAFSKMKTVRLALQHFHKLLKGSHVLVWTCNITVVFYINLKRCWGQLWPILIELNLLCNVDFSKRYGMFQTLMQNSDSTSVHGQAVEVTAEGSLTMFPCYREHHKGALLPKDIL